MLGMEHFFALNGMWLVMLAIVLLQAFATVSFGLQARHRAGGLGALMFVAMVGVISLMALIFDAPTEQASRSIHLFCSRWPWPPIWRFVNHEQASAWGWRC